jgi:Ser/Thr protein kinase RdoA (MazF antagonist)
MKSFEDLTCLGRIRLAQVTIPSIPGASNCSLLRWLKGREIKKDIGPAHYRAQGRLLARLHNFSAQWQPPAGIAKRKYDWDGLFREALLEGYTQLRPLSTEQIQNIDLFLAASCVYISLWCAAMTHLYPKYSEKLHQRMEGAFKLVECFVRNQ